MKKILIMIVCIPLINACKPSEKDFIKFFNNDLTFFCNDLPQMYEMLDCVSID